MQFSFIFVILIIKCSNSVSFGEILKENINREYDYKIIDKKVLNNSFELVELLQLPNDENQFLLKKFELNIETIICTDYSVFELHRNILKNHLNVIEIHQNLVINHIKAYYTQIVQDINQRYKESFKNDDELSITIDIVAFDIALRAQDAPWSELDKYDLGKNSESIRMINADLALVEFNKWLESSEQSKRFGQFDYAFAVTAYDIKNKSDDKLTDYNGLGYISGICKEFYRGALIEERGAYSSVRSFAHELGHSLGAPHDNEEYSDSSKCSYWHNYLMSSNFHLYNRKNSWLFSDCSVKYIKQFFIHSSVHLNCLSNKPQQNESISKQKVYIYPGQIYSDKDQCKQLFGKESVPCYQYQSSFCEILYCKRNSSDLNCHFKAPAAEGTSCGNRKWCRSGECIYDANAPRISNANDDDPKKSFKVNGTF